jgi:phosphoribosylformimino-5-aminoimidazole carboxamide ribotide isomerase
MKLPAAWTALPPRAESTGGHRHFALLGQRGRGPARTAELEAVLDRGFRLLVPLSELRDRQAWLPGWQRLPPDPSAGGGSPAEQPPGGGGDLPLGGAR